jgi:hypothetical protein
MRLTSAIACAAVTVTGLLLTTRSGAGSQLLTASPPF